MAPFKGDVALGRRRIVRSKQARKAYAFLVAKEKARAAFSIEDLRAASGWASSTTQIYLQKKLSKYVTRGKDGLRCSGVARMTEDAFCRLFSQKADIASEPERPDLPTRAEARVRKAREAALAAIQHYNNPTAQFRSGNFIVLMVIAYTALFHAVFERDGIDYTEQSSRKRGKLTRYGEPYLWDMVASAKRYFEGQTNPILENLQMMRDIRDKIEHRFLPALDADLAGHCQAMLMNFEEILCKEFTSYYSLNSSLVMPLYLSAERSNHAVAAMRRFQTAEYQELRSYLRDYQEALSDEVLASPQFCFRVWLFPKTVNRESASDLALEFVPIDDLESRQDLERAIVAIKTKTRFVDGSLHCNLWEKEVLDRLRTAIGPTVNVDGQLRELTCVLFRKVRDKLGIDCPSEYYYRSGKPGDRPRYSEALVDLIIREYGKDPDLFSSEPSEPPADVAVAGLTSRST